MPITVSTISVLMYLMSEGFGLALAQYFFPAALLSVTIAALWMERLEHDVRTRLVRMIVNRFLRKDFA